MKYCSWGLAVVAVLGVGMAPVAAGPKAKKAPLALELKDGGTFAGSKKRTGPLRRAPIKNFGVVTPGLVFRGGQPDEAGFRWLKEQGFRSVVSLRKEYDDGKERMAGYGFNYLHLSIVNEDAPSMAQADQFLQFAAKPGNWPLYLHCGEGIGRASTMAALVRYSFDGWNMGLAMAEARNYRPLHFPLFGRQAAFLKKWARKHPKGSFRPAVEGTQPRG